MLENKSISREIVPGQVWGIARPFFRFGAKVGGRASIIKLSNGDLFVISPTPIESDTESFISSIGGQVKYLLAPDIEHYMSLKAWKQAYPEATVIGPKPLADKLTDVKFDIVMTPEHLDEGFGDDEILIHYFPGYFSFEIAVLHVASGSFFNADLAECLPALEAFSKTPEVDPKTGFKTHLFMKMFSPHNWLHEFVLGNVLAKDKNAMKRDVKVVSDWKFDRLVPCHGDVMETGAKKWWNDLYARFLH